MFRWRPALIVSVAVAFLTPRVSPGQILTAASNIPPVEEIRADTDDLNGPAESDGGQTNGVNPAGPVGASSANIRGAIEDSIRLLLIQHGFRVSTEQKTRRELGGPFFGDYHRSVRMPRQWGDTDSGLTNYILHPGQGATSGFIWLQNTPEGQRPFATSREYFVSRLWATVWATGYSLQFEIGPLSEASIGNVGMNPETTGWVDHVMTPVGGFVIMVAEDMLDKFVVRKLEDRTESPVVRAMLRMFLTPSRATANVSGMRSPWYRAGRPITD
jgi:hypothetical protein